MQIDERRILIVPSRLVSVQPVDQVIVIDVAHVQQILLVGYERLP